MAACLLSKVIEHSLSFCLVFHVFFSQRQRERACTVCINSANKVSYTLNSHHTFKFLCKAEITPVDAGCTAALLRLALAFSSKIGKKNDEFDRKMLPWIESKFFGSCNSCFSIFEVAIYSFSSLKLLKTNKGISKSFDLADPNKGLNDPRQVYIGKTIITGRCLTDF